MSSTEGVSTKQIDFTQMQQVTSQGKIHGSGNEIEEKTTAVTKELFQKAPILDSSERSFKATITTTEEDSEMLESTYEKGATVLEEIYGENAGEKINQLYHTDTKDIVSRLYGEEAPTHADEIKENLTARLDVQSEVLRGFDELELEEDTRLKESPPGTFVIRGTNPPGGVTIRTYIGEDHPNIGPFVDEVFQPPFEGVADKIYDRMTNTESSRTLEDANGGQVEVTFKRAIPFEADYVL